MTSPVDPRLIAFYLPQFHPCPENDAWWQPGFTEWTNVTRSRPLFPGHLQPRLPADLGFYDLRLGETREAQADLARRAGVHGFCYYHYWFAGKRLLHRPLDDLIATGRPDFPFCVCWANESWTRRWDGLEREVLIAQQYEGVEPESFIRDLLPALRDPRYVRVNGKALVLVYRPEHIPNPAEWAERWQRFAHTEGVGDLYLCRVQSFSIDPPEKIGFDAAVEFPPLGPLLERSLLPGADVAALVGAGANFQGMIADYRRYVQLALEAPRPTYRRFRGVVPSWDNTPRRKNRALVFLNANPSDYEAWLTAVLHQCSREQSGDERLVFINAWNEWAEGCHLEPDEQWGDRYLIATRMACAVTKLHNATLGAAEQNDAGPLLALVRSRESTLHALSAEVRKRDGTIGDLRRALAASELAARSARIETASSARTAKTGGIQTLATGGRRPPAVIFGAGAGGERAYRHLTSAWEIVAFVDNDPHKQGGYLLDKPVIIPSEIGRYKTAAIFIASMYGDEIQKQLLGLGLERHRIRHVDAQVLRGAPPPAPDSTRQLEVIIFGTGQGGLRAFQQLPPECHAIAFADSDSNKAGLQFCGLPILLPSELPARNFDHIIVASMYADEIVPQLEKLGVPPHKIECVHPDILSGRVTGTVAKGKDRSVGGRTATRTKREKVPSKKSAKRPPRR